MFDYTIGIPTRNEELTLYETLNSLNTDFSTHPVRGNIETVICVNGTTDHTLERIISAQKDFPALNIQAINSEPGLVQAQRKIIQQANSRANFVLFYNADIRIHPGTTRRIVHYMQDHAEAHAVSGDQKPLALSGVVYTMLNIEALCPELFKTPRKYLIGRCFAIRKNSYYVPGGFLSDDMFLSNNLVATHGNLAVQQVPDAFVYYVGPRTIKDYFRKIKRYSGELEKLYKSYPEFLSLKSHFERKPDPKLVQRLPTYTKMLLLNHDIIKYLLKKIAHISLAPTWVPLTTTKDRRLYE